MPTSILQQFFWLVTPVSTFIAVLQLRKKKQSRVKSFENEMNQRYRDLTREIPVRALLGAELDDDEFDDQFEWLYYYVDFTNEQVYLRQEGKVSHETWQEWAAGIESHMERPSFERAWREIDDAVGDDFDELRRFLDTGDDPRAVADKSRFERIKYWAEQNVPMRLPSTTN